MSVKLKFRRHTQRLAVCRLGPDAPVPAWAGGGSLMAVVRTPDELSIVCAEGAVPVEMKSQGGWAAVELIGPFDFGLTGILAAALAPLAEAKVAIFAISTFDTDWILIPAEKLETAVRALIAAGHNEI